MKSLLIIILLIVLVIIQWPTMPVTPVQHNIQLVDFPGSRSYTNIKQDIAAHTNHWRSFGDTLVDIHENTHLIDGDLSIKYGRPAFYVLNNRVAVVDDIKQTLSQLALDIPMEYRLSHFKMYVIDSQANGHDSAIYIFEELNAYLNDTEASLTMSIPFDGNNKAVEELLVYTLFVEGTDPLFLKYEVQRALACGSKIPVALQSKIDAILAY